jgi:starvation-inducible DNA-binding protein
MKPKIGIEPKNLAGLTAILNRVLSDEYVLYTKTRNYHWNVTGPDFSELHKFFEAQYEELDEIIDETAERTRALGGRSLGTLSEFLKQTELKENPGEKPEARKMIANLLADHEAVIERLREDVSAAAEKYRDAGTSDFLTGLMEQHEKMAWMLRSYLE